MQEAISEQIKHGLTEKDDEQSHTALEHFVHLLVHPGRLLLSPVYRHVEKRYTRREKFEIKFLLTDILLLLIALGIIGSTIGWLIWHNQIENRIFFEAQVAPTEIVAGAPSTLIIRYTNGTGQELRNAYLNLTYPAHFQLQELASGETPVEGSTISLGNLAPDAVGSIKIRGIMFGDVGGEQTFETKMTFSYGDRNRSGEKNSHYVFSPVRSVLQLSLEVPERIIASQSFTGAIVYKNTGEFDLPEIIIKPEWPGNFHLISQSPNSWNLLVLKAGEEKKVEFTGTPEIGAETLAFAFSPAFVFGAEESKQETLKQNVSVVKPQIAVSHSVDASSVKPGSSLSTLIKYENTGDTDIYGVEIALSSTSPFVSTTKKISIGDLAAHTSGEKEISLPLRSSITQSETKIYEHLNIETTALATYKMENSESSQTISISDSSIATPLTTPVTLRSLGRYASDQGDQLGRGPLPPLVGEETKYWIFWNVSGTTNEIKNLTISGQLPSNVTFTGRQTVSEGQAVSYNETTKTVSWQTTELSTTFAPNSKIVGIAFEVAITPTENQINTSPTLISNVSLSGTDGWTNAWLTASGALVTTNLPNDSMAAGLGKVE